MDRFAGDVAVLLLVGTPLLVVAKLVHGLASGRASFARPGSRRARAEPVAWLLLGAVDAHTAALWSTFANQAEDLCRRYRPDLGDDVRLDGGDLLDYPVDVRCVWRAGESVAVTTWPLDAVAALLVLAAVAVAARARRGTARQSPDPPRPPGESTR